MPRFVPVGAPSTPSTPSSPPGGSGRFVRVNGPSQGPSPSPQAPGTSSLEGAFAAGRVGAGLAGLGGQAAGSPLLTGGSQVAGGLAGLGSGALNLSQGNTARGALGVGGGLGQVASGVGRLLPQVNETLGGGLTMGGQGLGVATGLAGLGLGLSEGGQAGERAAVQAAMQLMGSLVPGIGMVNLIGSAVETGVNALLGEGPFGPTPLPFTGRGVGNNWLSSADNAASQISAMTGLKGATALQGAIQKAETPNQLFGLALGGSQLSPHGELQFYMTGPNGETLSGGKGGVQETPAHAAYTQLVQQAAQGDPGALREFISRVKIQSGESGAAKDDYLLTDWYRRKLLSVLPETHPVRQDMVGLFEPLPANQTPDARAMAYLQAINQMEQQTQGGGGYSRDSILQALMGGAGASPNLGEGGHGTLSTLFRPANELISPAQAAQYASQFVPYRPPAQDYGWGVG